METNDINLLEPQLPITPEPQLPENKKRRLFFCIIIPLIVVIGFFFAIKQYASTKWSQNSTTDQTTLKPKINIFQAVKNFFFQPNDVLQGQREGRVNILLLGIGGEGHDGPYLSDTNIIASIKPDTNEVALISIPRDLAINIEGYGTQRINYANALGEKLTTGQGGEFARKIFEKTFGISIPYYIRVDFKAFKDLVDAVDGVELNVPKSFFDTSYPGPNESYQTVSFQAGQQTMKGEQALEYARSRHGNNGEGSDFARAKRQQLVLSALKAEMLSAGTYLNPVKIQKILSSLSSHIATNLDFSQIMYLAGLSRSVDENVKTFVLDNSENGLLDDFISYEGAYMLRPRDGNFTKITNTINNIFESTSTPTFGAEATNSNTETDNKSTTSKKISNDTSPFSTADIEIQNGTWYVGLAAKYKQILEEKGFAIENIGNCYERPVTNTIIYVINPKTPKEIITSLGKELGSHTTSILPNWLVNERVTTSTDGTIEEKYKADTDILVVIGIDAVK